MAAVEVPRPDAHVSDFTDLLCFWFVFRTLTKGEGFLCGTNFGSWGSLRLKGDSPDGVQGVCEGVPGRTREGI